MSDELQSDVKQVLASSVYLGDGLEMINLFNCNIIIYNRLKMIVAVFPAADSRLETRFFVTQCETTKSHKGVEATLATV
jgi:hypothetical protein